MKSSLHSSWSWIFGSSGLNPSSRTGRAAMAGLALATALAMTVAAGPLAAAPGLPSTNVAWLPAASDAEVDRAFALAKSQRKPVVLYWGASWCPPCNQLKATLFNRQDFAALSRSFVAVHVDGDRPGAQVLGRRFKVSGYPTVVVFNDQGVEITRLPGEVDAPQVMAVLQLGLAGGRPVKAVLADALAGKALAASDWRLLSFYSWETDDQRLVQRSDLADTLVSLALASPAKDIETNTRLWLKAIAASDEGQGLKPDAALRARVQQVLVDPLLSRQHADVLNNSAAEIMRALYPEAGADRDAMVQRYDAALKRLQADGTLSRGDRMTALTARVRLARLHLPKAQVQLDLPAPLLNEVRTHVSTADREITDGYERQAVITEGAFTLGLAGLWPDSDALLKSNLARSHSAYYLMSQLGGNARKLGRTSDALSWYRQAFEKSEGPATRLQWGLGYLNALVDLSPKDAATIEKTAMQLLDEAGKDPGAFAGRSGRTLSRAGSKLNAWAEQGSHDAALKRLRSQTQTLCTKVDAAAGERAACEALFKPA